MLTTTLILTALLTGCAPGMIGGGRSSDSNLDRVLKSDSEVPARQGFLFMAMQDAEVARQSASYAVAADSAADAKAHISNVLYAIDASYPATPTVTSTGIASFWPGTGYGLRRSVEGISDQMSTVSSRYGSRERVVEQAGQVTSCAEQTLTRIDQLERLGQQALAAGSVAELTPLLAEIDLLTHVVLEAPAAQAVDACSLEDTKRYLDGLALQLA
jgi:hypothetical protein